MNVVTSHIWTNNPPSKLAMFAHMYLHLASTSLASLTETETAHRNT